VSCFVLAAIIQNTRRKRGGVRRFIVTERSGHIDSAQCAYSGNPKEVKGQIERASIGINIISS
jgi:hypothetical protein